MNQAAKIHGLDAVNLVVADIGGNQSSCATNTRCEGVWQMWGESEYEYLSMVCSFAMQE
jgi:hypothetical protein